MRTGRLEVPRYPGIPDAEHSPMHSKLCATTRKSGSDKGDIVSARSGAMRKRFGPKLARHWYATLPMWKRVDKSSRALDLPLKAS